jgi:hypothetical protein
MNNLKFNGTKYENGKKGREDKTVTLKTSRGMGAKRKSNWWLDNNCSCDYTFTTIWRRNRSIK